MNRNTMSERDPGATIAGALATAPTREPMNIKVRGLKMSARLPSALTSVPATKPACTAMVSHAACPGGMLNSRTSRGVTAVAENHSVMPRNWASETTASILHADDIIDVDVQIP